MKDEFFPFTHALYGLAPKPHFILYPGSKERSWQIPKWITSKIDTAEATFCRLIASWYCNQVK
jgi:hypothetical protein